MAHSAYVYGLITAIFNWTADLHIAAGCQTSMKRHPFPIHLPAHPLYPSNTSSLRIT